MKVKFLPGEVWYGPTSDDGSKMPFDEKTSFSMNLQPANTGNQYSPLLISN